MAKRVARFTRGSGAYKCVQCGKNTRETGEGESTVNMCAACYEIAGQENYHSDEGHEGGVWECTDCMDMLSEKAHTNMPACYAPEKKALVLDVNGLTYHDRGEISVAGEPDYDEWQDDATEEAPTPTPTPTPTQEEVLGAFGKIVQHELLLAQGKKIKGLEARVTALQVALDRSVDMIQRLFGEIPYGSNPYGIGVVESHVHVCRELIRGKEKPEPPHHPECQCNRCTYGDAAKNPGEY